MPSNREMVSRVRSSFKITSSDSVITDRAILAQLQSIAATYIIQQANRRKFWDSVNLFTPLKVEMEEVPLADYCEYQSSCTVGRSKYKLPRIGEGIFSLMTQGLYTLDRKKNKFIEMSASRYANVQALGLPGNNVYYWIFNEYLFISDPHMEVVILPAFIPDGKVPPQFTLECDDDNGGCPQNPLDQPFKCPAGMEELFVSAIANFYNKTYRTSVADNASDDVDESK